MGDTTDFRDLLQLFFSDTKTSVKKKKKKKAPSTAYVIDSVSRQIMKSFYAQQKNEEA